jgi:16S rRNA processing protein RimM
LTQSFPGTSSQRDKLAFGADKDQDWVFLAKIVRPQGRHGEVLADLLTDFPDRFAERKRLFLIASKTAHREIELERHWLHQGRVVLKFKGVDSINDAETLRGIEVAIPKSERAPLEDGAAYISDLIGCRIFDVHSGTDIGLIVDVDRESTATALLVVETEASGQVLVPFAKAYDPKLDLGAKRMEMNLPEGLLDLNAPATGAGGRGPQA